MNPQDFIVIFISVFSNPDLIARIILLILLSLYVLFAIIVVMQIKSLSVAINQGSSSMIILVLAWIHVIIPVALLLFTVLTL